MNTLNQSQKIILAVLALLNIIVIGGMITIVVTTMRTPASTSPPPPTWTPAATREVKPEWTPTTTPTTPPTIPPRPTRTATLTMTPFPTITPSPVPPTPTPMPITLNNGGFDMLMPNRIPGWTWDAYINYKPGDEANSDDSYAEPFFMAADDAARQIDGSTLKVETMRWLKFRAWVHQTITVTANIEVFFQVKANAFSSLDRLIVKVGIDPTGAENCYDALWGQARRINQDDGIVTLVSPVVRIEAVAVEQATPELEHGEQATPELENRVQYGRVTVCIYAEPTYSHVNNAAFFDEAELVIQ